VGSRRGRAVWRKQLFLATSQINANAADYFRLPRERTVIVGSRIELWTRRRHGVAES
jgi:KUP system potassium uptake protein